VDIIEIIDKLMEVSLYFKFDHFEFSMQASQLLHLTHIPSEGF
jgi:hypothetical protein